MSFAFPRIVKFVSAAFSALAALLFCAVATVVWAQTPTVITNPALGVFTGGNNLTAKIVSASVSGVVISATKSTGTFPSSGVLRLCRGVGNSCEAVLDASYAAGASTVTFPSFTPRSIRQDFYYVQRVDAVATTTGGLDPSLRSGSMIVIVDSVEAGRENAVQVSSNCALSTVGTVRCWARGGAPTIIAGLPSNVAAISVGWTQSCALAAGQVFCWGQNDYGQLGDGTTLARSAPVAVTGLSGVVTDIVSGERTSCALVGSSASCWGGNDYGQATGGLNAGIPAAVLTATPVSSLGAALSRIQLGDFFGCALKVDRTVVCWGPNGYGRLGNNVGLDTRLAYPATTVNAVMAVGLSVAVSGTHSCVQRGDATVACWGANASGQLGRGTTSSYEWQPAAASALQQTAVSLTTGSDSTCALLAGGSLTCWGSNSAGQLGIGVTADLANLATPPVRAPSSPIGLNGIVGGATLDRSRLCASLIDGAVRCAGNSGGLGDGSTNPSSVPVAVLGYGPAKASLPAPTISSITRLGNKANITYVDNLTINQAQILAHQWGCKANNSTWTGTGSEVQINESSGRSHVAQAEFDKVGPWQCQVRFRSADAVSAWSSWVDVIPARRVVTPTVLSATYDGAYGTITYEDNMQIAEGPVIVSGAVCNVQYGAYQASGTAGCYNGDSTCVSSLSVVEPTAARHTIRMPLPPGSAGVSSVSCHVNYSTYDGPVDTGNSYVTLAPVSTPPPSISSGRVVGNTGSLVFSDNLAASAGNVSSAVWSCTRIRDNATLSGSTTVNEPAGGNHTISFPLNSSDMLQNPDTFRCIVRIATTGLAGPFSTSFTIGPNSPPVVSNFAFTSNNGVITGAFDINDPEGDQVKNVIAYFGSTPRSMECSSGTLGASWDIPRGGGRVQFNASLANVGCAALTASATTIYGFVTAQDVNGLYATIVDAQASNTPPAPIPVGTTTTYSFVFDAVPPTLAVKQSVDITMRMVDQNGVTATQFNGPVKVMLSIAGIGFSVEDPINPAPITQAHRVIWLKNGVGRLRSLRIHDVAVLRLTAAAMSSGSFQLNPVVAAAQAHLMLSNMGETLKAGPLASSSVEYRGVSAPIKVGIVSGDTKTITFAIPQSSEILGSTFFVDWKNGATKAYLSSIDDPTSPPFGGVTPNAAGTSFSITAPYGEYRLTFVKAGAALRVREVKQAYTGSGGEMREKVTRDNLPIDNAKRKVLLVHGVFGSALQVSDLSEAAHKCLSVKAGTYSNVTSMPTNKCVRKDSQLRTLNLWGADQSECGQLSFLCETVPVVGGGLWQDLEAALTTQGYEVVTVPYDWRLTPDQAQREFLAGAIAREVATSGQPVDIVAHSMGGIVTLTYLASLAADASLASYVDRVLLLGTPVAGSVNAYGLMEVGDPMGLEGITLTKNGIYSSLAKYLWSASIQSARGPLVRCTKRVSSRSTSECLEETYDSSNTRADRQRAFTEQAPSGWFLYPNRAYLPFVGSATSAVSHIPDAVPGYFKNADSPNSLSGVSTFAECAASTGAATTTLASRKTRVSLLLSDSETTTSWITSKSGDLTKVNRWSDVTVFQARGDGTVPARGQDTALAAFLGTDVATLKSRRCLVQNAYGEHTYLTSRPEALAFVKERLPYPGTLGLASDTITIAKAAPAVATKFVVSTNGVADLTLRDAALTIVGRTRDVTVATQATNGATNANVTMRGNALAVVVNNPTAGTMAIQITGAGNDGASLNSLVAEYADGVSTSAKREVNLLIRAGTATTLNVTIAAGATTLPIEAKGPAPAFELKAYPGSIATRLAWSPPATSAVPITGYRIYASPSQDDNWTLVGSVAANTTSYVAAYPAASVVQREVSFVVVSTDAQDRYSEVLEFVSNRVRDDIEGNFGSARGTPGATVTSASITLPNNVLVSVSVAGGQMSVNGGAWSTTATQVNPYDTVALRGVAPATRGATQSVTLSTGTSSTTFSVLGTALPFCIRPTRPIAETGAFVRYLKLVTGLSLLQGLYPPAEVTTINASAVETHYRENLAAYDFNGDSATTLLIDGLLYTRYALGFRGAELVSGMAVGTVRTTAEIEAALAACQ